MKRGKGSVVLIALTAGSLVFTGCIVGGHRHHERAVVVVRESPPAPRVEVIPAPRHSDHVWAEGHWVWRNRWVWEPGHYVARPRHGASWRAGHWDHTSRGWVWVEGGWY
jgi:hypothetical protein